MARIAVESADKLQELCEDNDIQVKFGPVERQSENVDAYLMDVQAKADAAALDIELGNRIERTLTSLFESNTSSETSSSVSVEPTPVTIIHQTPSSSDITPGDVTFNEVNTSLDNYSWLLGETDTEQWSSASRSADGHFVS